MIEPIKDAKDGQIMQFIIRLEEPLTGTNGKTYNFYGYTKTAEGSAAGHFETIEQAREYLDHKARQRALTWEEITMNGQYGCD